MKRRILSFVMAAFMLIGCVPITAGAATNISVGDYVQMGAYYGEPILWRCVDIDENGPLMLADKIICVKPYDAAGDDTSGSHSYPSGRQSYGSNYWADSNMRSWLNSNAGAGNVMWLCGNPPDNDHVYGGYNDYAEEAGFMTNFSSAELSAVKEVTQKSILSTYDKELDTTGAAAYHTYDASISDIVQNYDSCYAENITDKFFLLDVKQVNAVYNNSDVLGDDYYIGELTEQCVANSEYQEEGRFEPGRKWTYWLRSPFALFSQSICYVFSSGNAAYDDACGAYGVRPAFYLADNAIQSGSGTEEDPYGIENAEPAPTDSPSQEINILDGAYYSVEDGNIIIHFQDSINIGNPMLDEKALLVLAVYDGDVLMNTKIIAPDESIKSISLNDITINTSRACEDLTVKAFLWTDAELKPMCGAYKLSTAPANSEVYGWVTNTYKGGLCGSDEVFFNICYAESFDGESVNSESGEINIFCNTAADISDRLYEPVTAHILINEEGYTILDYAVDENRVKEFKPNQLDLENSAETALQIDGNEYKLSEELLCNINGVDDSLSFDEIIEYIKEMDSKYSRVRLIDMPSYDEDGAIISDADGIYDLIVLTNYIPVEILNCIYDSEEKTYSLDTEELGTISFFEDDDSLFHNTMNENFEPCSLEALLDYEGKTIYIEYNYDIESSYFCNIILEGAEPAVFTENEPELYGAVSEVYLRYDEKNGIAFFDGNLEFNCYGDENFSVSLDVTNGDETIYSRDMSCAYKSIDFCTEWDWRVVDNDGEYLGTKYDHSEGYQLYSQRFDCDKKPDSAVITVKYKDGSEDSFDIPIISAGAYKVYGRITDYNKAESKLNFQVERSFFFQDGFVEPDQPKEIEVTGDNVSELCDLIGEYAIAYVSGEDNNWRIESINILTDDKNAEIYTENIDFYSSEFGNYYCVIYASDEDGNLIAYRMTDEVNIFINGEKYGTTLQEMMADEIEELFNNYTKIRLLKTSYPGSTSTDGRYDAIKLYN